MTREAGTGSEAEERRLARWVAAVTTACALLGYGASAFTLGDGGDFDLRRDGGLAVLMLAPLLVGPAVLRGPGGSGAATWRAYAAIAVGALQALLAARLFDLHDGTEIVAVLAAAQGHALARVPLAGASGLSLCLSLAQSAAALRVRASDEVFVLLFVQVVLAALVVVLLQARQARAQLARNRRALFAPARLRLAARLGFGLRLGAWVLPATLLLLALATRAGDARWLRTDGAVTRRAEEAIDMPDRIDDSGRDPTLWREDSGLGEGVSRLSDEVVLTLRARSGGSDASQRLRALWLTVLPLDTFEGSSLGNPDLGRMRALDDGDDGQRDGWVSVRAPGGGESLQLDVLQRALRVSSTDGDALVRCSPLLAVQAPRVVFSPDAALVVPGERGERFAYRLECVAPWSLEPPDAARRARHPDARYVQLPPDSPALRRIEEVARQATAGATTDLARVRAVLDFLSRGFSYSLEGSGFAGVDGVVRFLEERAGYCTAYAATAVLLLRSVGISARAVGGYLAREFDPFEGLFVVRGRDAHAWIEVHYEGLGWRTYDPTPPSARAQAFARAGATLPDPGLSAWSGELLRALRASALEGGPQGSLTRVREVLAAAPEAAVRSALRAPWRAGFVGAALLLSATSLLLRTRRGGSGGGAGSRARGEPDVPFYAKLLRALGRLGLRPMRGETPREFGARVARQGLAGLEDVPRVTELFYAARFGGREPDANDRAFVKRVLAQVRAAPSSPRGSGSSISSET